MTNQNKSRAALIIRKIQQDPKYLEDNFFYQNALSTFKVLNIIDAIDHRLINGNLLARLTRLLISLEIKPGGPYSKNKQDIDPELNTEIAIFLNHQGVRLSSLEPFIDRLPAKKENSKIFEHIHYLAIKRLRPLPKSFQSIIRPKLEEIINSDQDKQILLLAYFFKLSLGNIGAKIEPRIINELGVANLFLWLSYSLYDDLIDNDTPLDSLPIANWAAREFILTINKQGLSREYKLLFEKIMARMDYSQIWERKYARFQQDKRMIISAKIENYQKPSALYAKSLAHCLGPMLILDQLKHNPNSIQGKNTLSFFKYYLSIRQLQDDIYDFKADYQKGIITSANIRMIKNNIDQTKINNYFIQKELPRLNNKIIRYQEIAEKHLRAATIIKYPNYLNQFLSPLKINPQETQSFLKTYKNLDNQDHI